jgi:hypothetical protein
MLTMGIPLDETATVIVCERWTMPLGRREPASQWFLDWVMRRPKESSQHVTAGFAAYSALAAAYPGPQPFTTATEYFGGMGCQSLMIQNLYGPEQHTVIEQHPLAAGHLNSLLRARPGARIILGDAYASDEPADLIGLDFGNLTILQAQTAMKPLLDRVFAAGPKAVVLTDIAGQRLHLQRKRYAELLGRDCPDYEAYLRGLAAYLERTYGYRLLACFHHRWSAVLALVPATVEVEPLYAPPPESPQGILLRQ